MRSERKNFPLRKALQWRLRCDIVDRARIVMVAVKEWENPLFHFDSDVIASK
jgi:hypothetical protein